MPSDETAAGGQLDPMPDPYATPGPGRRTRTRVRYSRPFTDRERDVLIVAAELTRASWDMDLPPGMHERMQAWSRRLKAAHDELVTNLRVDEDD